MTVLAIVICACVKIAMFLHFEDPTLYRGALASREGRHTALM